MYGNGMYILTAFDSSLLRFISAFLGKDVKGVFTFKILTRAPERGSNVTSCQLVKQFLSTSRDPKLRCRVSKNLSLVPLLNHINAVHTLLSDLFYVHLI
jgi:hypothetical protein